MAGFFGLFNYAKPGKGVDKDAPKKKRFFVFFELYFRKFTKLVQLNLLFVLCCIPVVTIGPAMAAMSKVLKEMVNERPVFLVSDFFEAFKKNFKQGFIVWFLDTLAITVITYAVFYYMQQADKNMAILVPLLFVCFAGFMLLLMNYYIFLMVPLLDMKLRPMIKNAFLLSILGIKTNICTLFFTVLFTLAVFFYPVIGIALAVIFYFSSFGFIVVFNSYQHIDKYIIQPYYDQTGEKRPDVYYFDDEFDEALFTDIGSKEQPVANVGRSKKTKTIK